MALYKPYTRYKNAGLSWLKEIPENWEVISFKNILKERNEKNDPIKSTERLSLSIDKGVTLYSEKTTNLDRFKDDFTQYKLAYKNDLVFNSMNMIVGAVGVSKYFGCVSPVYYTYYSQDNNPSASKFYEYLFKCKTIQGVLFSLGKGLIAIDRGDGKYNTLRLKISREDLRSLKLPIPEQTEQTAIVRFLDYKTAKINRFIRKKKQLIKLLNEQKAAIINQAVTKGVNPDVKMKDSGIEWLGEIPEHWEKHKLKYLVTKPIAGAWGAEPQNNENDITCVRVADFNEYEIKTDNLTNRNIDAKTEQILKPGDLLLEKSGGGEKTPVGRVVLFNQSFKAVTSNFVSKFSPKIDLVSSEYLLYIFKLINSVRWNFRSLKQTTGIQNIDTYQYMDNWVFIPKVEEQRIIANHIKSEFKILDETISTIRKEIDLVEEYKTALITEAVTGKINVRDYQFPDTETEDEGYEELEKELALVAEESEDYQTEEME
ncbi:restriction endonuclease subunit S [Sphingobacterium spiritivorum]|uniref:restriction endonuclease subunit S n=1 Tax=Sphingobacterium spiritivorum TaxID=258 RepID=UPI003DA583CF